jgi:16S rRNA (guanine966-N2)-methyltransferase
MRIIAGKFKGRNLAKSDHLKTLRPTTEKNRESLFNILASAKFIKEIGFELADKKILDVCCGSGAVGFEALSRGAKSVVFIDNNLAHLDLVKKNCEILQTENCVKILQADVKKIAKFLPKNEEFFDLVFIDPPYEEDYELIIQNLLEKCWIKQNSLIVVEFKANSQFKKTFSSPKPIEKVDFHKNQKSFADAPIQFLSPINSKQNQVQIKSNLIEHKSLNLLDLRSWGKTAFGFFYI